MRTGTVLRVALGVALGAGVLTWFFVTPRKGKSMSPETDARTGRMTPASNDNPPAISRESVEAETSMDEALAQSFPASDPPASATPLTIGPPGRTAPRKQDDAVREPAEASA